MPVSQKSLTKVSSGTLGNNQAQFSTVASIVAPGKGRYEIWGNCRHTLIDGCKLFIGATTIIANISAAAGQAAPFGPIVYDVTNSTHDIIIQLATATGAADTASATIYAQRLDG